MAGDPREPLDATVLTAAIGSLEHFSSIEVIERTGSTNADLVKRALCTDDDIAGVVRAAECQVSGRGRHQRSWATPPRAALAMSVAIPVDTGALGDALGWLPLLTGVAVADAIGTFGASAALKWPNDVLVNALKVAGILVELTGTPGRSRAVIGIGVNTGVEPAELPVQTATSLHTVIGHEVDRTALATAILVGLDVRLTQWTSDLDRLRNDYRACSDTLGRKVRVVLPAAAELLGTAVRIDDLGRVVIQADSGEVRAVAAGDVTHLRALQ